MGLFRPPEAQATTATQQHSGSVVTPSRQGTAPTPPPDESQTLAAGDWDEDDPRRLRHEIFMGAGLAYVWWWPADIEELWWTVVGRAPALGQILPRANGVAQLQSDQNTHVFGLDGPRGSAIVLLASENSDFGHLITNIQDRLKGVGERGVKMSMLHQGKVDRGAAEIIESSFQVQLAEMHGRAGETPARHSVLPPWARRKLNSWTEVAHDLYRRELVDSDGDSVYVWCLLHNGRPAVVYPFISEISEDQLRQLAPLGEYIDGELTWLDPQAAAMRILQDSDVDVTAMAQSLVDGIARGLTALGPEFIKPASTEEIADSPEEARPGTDSAPHLQSGDQLFAYLRGKYKIAEELKSSDSSVVTGCRLVFRMDDERSQMATISVEHIADQPWFRISSGFGTYGKLDIAAALLRVGHKVCGDVRLSGETLTLSHAGPILDLNPDAFDAALSLIVGSAEQLEKEFSQGDDF